MSSKIFLVLIILLVSFFLRFHNYTVYPQRGATSDEYTYSFLGVSLLTKGVPISWSHFDYPEKRLITMHDIVFPIVSPYFDHPPLFGLLVGGFSLLFGQSSFEKIDLATIRLVPLFLSLISSILLFLIAQKLYTYKVAVWALLIYSTATVFVMNSRVVVSETLLTPLLLGALSLFIYSKNITTKKAIVLGVLAGLALLTKVLGIAVFLILLFLLVIHKAKVKVLATGGVVFLFIVGTLLLYAVYFDWNLFWQIQKAQGARETGPQTLWLLLRDATIVNKTFTDGWYFFGFMALFFLFSDYRKHLFIIVPSFIYLTLLLLTLTRYGHSGWYMIPLFPFMSIAIAYVLAESLKKESWLFLIFLLFIGMTEIGFIYEGAFGLNNLVYRLLTVILVVPFFVAMLVRRDDWFRFLENLWFYLFILGNVFLTYTYIHPS